jgi:hypothetical protein
MCHLFIIAKYPSIVYSSKIRIRRKMFASYLLANYMKIEVEKHGALNVLSNIPHRQLTVSCANSPCYIYVPVFNDHISISVHIVNQPVFQAKLRTDS